MKRLFLLPLLLLFTLTGCSNNTNNSKGNGSGTDSAEVDTKDSKTPLKWCIHEIRKQKGYTYDEYGYSYQEIENEHLTTTDEGYLFAYYITFISKDRVGEWYCRVVVKHDSGKWGNAYKESEVKSIKCILISQIFF